MCCLFITGASLAQDRGRLESQIETLQSEMTMAKKQIEVLPSLIHKNFLLFVCLTHNKKNKPVFINQPGNNMILIIFMTRSVFLFSEALLTMQILFIILEWFIMNHYLYYMNSRCLYTSKDVKKGPFHSVSFSPIAVMNNW